MKFHNLERFLKHGDKAKITMVFRGREMNYISTGRRVLERLASPKILEIVKNKGVSAAGREMRKIVRKGAKTGSKRGEG